MELQGEGSPNKTLYDELNETSKALIDAGKKVYIIGDVPGFKIDPTLCKYERKLRNYTHCSEPVKNNIRRNKKISENLALLAQEINGLNYIEISDALCDNEKCHMNKNMSYSIEMEIISILMALNILVSLLLKNH